jgi:hypothetical protein
MQELLRLQEQQKGSAVNDPVFKQNQDNTAQMTAALKDNVDNTKKELKQTQSLIDNLKELRDAIKQNVKTSMNNSRGEGVARQVQAAGNKAPAEKTLKQVLFGKDSKEDVENKSWTKKLGFSKTPTMALYDWADKKDKKKAYEKEKSDYVANAIKHDPNTYRTANFKGGIDSEEGKAAATKKAESDFEKIKAKEAELLKIQNKMDSATGAGYNPLEKDIKSRNTLAGQLTELDPRKQRTEPSEEQTEAKVASDNASKALITAETAIGTTATESLKIQREQLETLKQILKVVEEGGGSGGGGGGFGLGDVADLVGGRGGKSSGPAGKPAGKPGIGSKAMKFLRGTGGKLLGAVGAVGFGAYAAYEGVSDANEQQALRDQEIDAALERGEINEKQAEELKKQNSDTTDVKKGEAVGEGTGMAAGGIAGAAGGAAVGGAIGSAFFGVGAVPGALIGGAIGGIGGAIAGSEIGKKAGGAIVEGYQGVRNFFGFGNKDKEKAAEQAAQVEGGPKPGEDSKSWFDKTAIGQAWNDRDIGLDAGVGVRQGEQMITAENNLERKTTSGENGATVESKFNKGITNEKTAMGSGFLARLLAPKGTETEKFLADTADTKGDKTNHSGFMGTRKEGGLFSKDEYTLIDTNTYDQFKVEKDTFMKAKEIAAKGGDASAIYELLREDPLVQKQRETEGLEAAKKLGVSPEGMTPPPSAVDQPEVVDTAAQPTPTATPAMETPPLQESPVVEASRNNEEIRSDVEGGGSTIINAPNNSVTNSGGSQPDSSTMRSPIRNPESSVSRYIDSKYAV